MDIALRSRPDLKLARLNEEVAEAGLKLARSEGVPNVTAFSKYTVGRSVFDDTPVGVLVDRDKLLTFGVSVDIVVVQRLFEEEQVERLHSLTDGRGRFDVPFAGV